MKTLKSLILIAGIFLGLFGCSSKNIDEKVESRNFKSTGVVKKINTEKGEIAIDHQEIPNLMGAMTMDFPVKDKKLLGQVKENDKVEFELVRENGVLSVSKIEKIGQVTQINSGEIYKTNCAKCHGETGEGVDKKGITFLKGHALDHTQEDFIKRVTDGKDDEMPSFKGKLSEEEIKAVVRFVREELQSKADPKDKAPHKH